MSIVASVSENVWNQVSRDYGVTDEGAAEALTGVRRAMDRIEAGIGPSGYLVGDSFSVADLTAAALFTPIVGPPERPYSPRRLTPDLAELREELQARPGGEWVFEMYARHRSPRVASAAP